METKTQRICENCHLPFDLSLRLHNRYEKTTGKGSGRFCSRKCWYESKHSAILLTCIVCNATFTRKPSHLSKNNFCSQSCAATYQNTHKTYGTRRSKLEAYLEQQLRSEFPDLELICNGKEEIGSELDFYFPQLRLAIELNGIFHYEPIYGSDKLERTQANDQQKFIACNAAGIELCIISCTDKSVTKSVKERYLSIVKNLVTPLLKRAEQTNVQVS